ncbi:transmembrane protein, putative (macronuclear) [Tetrahymena thermophila SB210]|uniref:Transmembrane protein, putative n=1 Tax=Tetrahymena thermophila (strain SB210) TaxID=312017 RepID=Q233Z7_TETTS|nr:transmembrane protein, putative [Tetrahymena thermophila SB210]EAR92105.2 transmembrane protein, putative [Tetrahymena thermophila SB210]|eukprot:XP_001012351.2 transmembrane protein, putative [Tetrahymena thermophila SB210]
MKLDLVKKAASIFYFLFVKSNQKKHTQIFFFAQNIVYFFQLISIFDMNVNSSNEADTYLQGYDYFLQLFRPFYLIHKQQIIDPVISLAFVFLFEVYFCYSMWKISNFNQNNILKDFIKYSHYINMTLICCEWNNHFFMIAKVDLLINLATQQFSSSYISSNYFILLIAIPAILLIFNSLTITYIYREIQFTDQNVSKPQAEDSLLLVMLITTLQQLMQQQNIKAGVYICGIFYSLYYIFNIHIINIPKKQLKLSCIQRTCAYSLFVIEILIIMQEVAPSIFQRQHYLQQSIFVCLIIYIVVYYTESRRFEVLFHKGINIKNIKQDQFTLFICQKLQLTLSQSDINYSQFLEIMGFLTSHKRICDNLACPCSQFQKQNDNLGLPSLFQLFKQTSLSFKKNVLDFIEFYLETKVEDSQKRKRIQNSSELFFKYIDFLIFQKKRYTKALYEIKKFQSKRISSNICSIICESLTYIIELCTIDDQLKLKFSKKKDDRDRLKEGIIFQKIIHSEEIIDMYKEKLFDILQFRNQIFQNLIEGYASNQQYQRDIESFIIQLEKIENSIKKSHNEFPENVHYLKFLIILRSILLNDPIECSKYEKILQENILVDKQKDYDKVTTYSMMGGECISIIVTYRNYQALIKKHSQRTPQFFQYAKEEFSTIKSINSLMPDQIGAVHDQIIQMLAKGAEPRVMNSYRMQFIQTKGGFITPIKLYYSYFFNHSVHELLFSCFMLKIRNSYEYLILNKGGWITDISSGFFYFLQETLGYEKLELEDIKNSNIVLYSTILLQYIANYELDGRHSQTTTVQSYRLCIPNDFCGMLKTFNRLKQSVSKKGIMFNNPEDDNLHKIKEQVFDQYYQQNVKTIDVQLSVRQETINYESNDDSSILTQKMFILEFQGLNISRDNKSSINQSISMALQMGKMKTIKDIGKNKGITVLSQLIKQAVIKQDVIGQDKQQELNNQIEANDEEDKARKRASNMIQTINEQIKLFKMENDIQQNKKQFQLEHIYQSSTIQESSLTSIQDNMENNQQQKKWNALNQSQFSQSLHHQQVSDQNFQHQSMKKTKSKVHAKNDSNEEYSKQSSFNQKQIKSKEQSDLNLIPVQQYIEKKQELENQLRQVNNLLNQVNEELVQTTQTIEKNQETIKSLAKSSTSKFSKQQTSKMLISTQNNSPSNKRKVRTQKTLNESAVQFSEDMISIDSQNQIGNINQNSIQKSSYFEDQNKEFSQQLSKNKFNRSHTSQEESKKHEKKQQKHTYSQALKQLKEKKLQQQLMQQQQNQQNLVYAEKSENSLMLNSSRNETTEAHSFEYIQEAALKKLEEETKLLESENQSESNDDDDDDEDYDEDDDEELVESEDEQNIMSMKDINQTFSSYTEQTRNIFGMEDDSNASRQRTFGRNQQNGEFHEVQQQQAITTNIKIINKISNDPSPPQEIKLFGIYFFFQIISFIIFISIALSLLYQSIQVFQQSMTVMWMTQEISKPLNIFIDYMNYKLLLTATKVPDSYSSYLDVISNEGYTDLRNQYESYFETQIEFNFQNQFQKQEVFTDLENINTPIHEEFLKIQTSINNFLKSIMDYYYLYLNQPTITGEEYLGTTLMPIISSQTIFSAFTDNVQSFLQQQRLNTIITNLILYLCFQVFTVFLFSLIFRGATMIKSKKEKLLKLISHITEKEGQVQIAKGKMCQQQIKSNEQEYLYEPLIIQQEILSNEQQEASQINKGSSSYRKKNIYLSDRINDQSVGITSSYLILIILFLLSSIIGATGLVLVSQLLSGFDTVINNNSNFLKGVNSYSFMNIAEDLLEVDRFYTNYSNYQVYLFNKTERANFTAFYNNELNLTIEYFTIDFLKLIEDSNIPKQYQNQIESIVSSRGTCNLTSIYTPQEQQLCINTQSSLMDNGFQNSIINVLEIIRNRKLETENDYSIVMLFNIGTYYDENIISFLQFRMIDQLITIFKDYTSSQLNMISGYLSIFYIVAGILNTILFILIFVLFKIYFLSPFIYLRRGLLLLPIERAAEDVNILSMIKSSLKIKF